MITLEKKKQVVEDLIEKLREAKGVYFVDFAKITVAKMTSLRRELGDKGIVLKVAKNTLVLRSLESLGGYDMPERQLFGQTALILSYDDAIAPAKVIKAIYDKEEKLRLKAAFIEGQFFDGKDLNDIAKLPSRAELVAGILGSLNAPISGIVGSINAVMRDVASLIEEVAKKQNAA